MMKIAGDGPRGTARRQRGEAALGEATEERQDPDGVMAPRMPMGPSFTVRRTELMRTIIRQARTANATIVVAPEGFGKTALLMQYVEEIAGDPGRGFAHLVDATGCTCDELIEVFETCMGRMPVSARPVIAVDNLPRWERSELERCVERMRELRDLGFEFIVSTVPSHADARALLRDATKIGAQALAVHPREYAAWARTFSIAGSLDVYGLTQGVPVLVTALSAAVQRADGVRSLLDTYVDSLYRAVLEDMRHESRALGRMVQMMLLMGSGTVHEIERAGVRLAPHELGQLVHDYPVFGIDVAEQRFSCLGAATDALADVRRAIASEQPSLVLKAVRALLRSERVDEAMSLASSLLDAQGFADVVSQHPLAFVLAGYGRALLDALAPAGDARGVDGVARARERVGVTLARYAASLTVGDFKQARALAAELRLRTDQIVEDVSAADWECACALARTWISCPGIALPSVSFGAQARTSSPAAARVRSYCEVLTRFLGVDPDAAPASQPAVDSVRPAVALDLGVVLALCGDLIDDLAGGAAMELDGRDAELAAAEDVLRQRGLVPVLVMVRTVISMRRLFLGAPVIDERAFADAGTMAVRLSDQPLQLACMVLEGWLNLSLGQALNAQFRGQQVLKLTAERPLGIHAWAVLLECVASLRNSSRTAVRARAELLDLASGPCAPVEAWTVALTLSAAGFEAELAAWFSLHRSELLETAVRTPVRLALSVLRERADAVRRLIPAALMPGYAFGGEDVAPEAPGFSVVGDEGDYAVGQLCINLLGGFQVTRNGHTLTDDRWRQRKTSALAARLVLAMGTFVSRRVLIDEFWPDADYRHARNSLYSALTALRRAFGQVQGGPQYLITQGGGVAINLEYVRSDVMQFEALAREILIKKRGVSGPQVVTACLKMEQTYTGRLFVPESSPPPFFLRMRNVLQNRYADCMLRGITVALEEDDVASASWLVDAVLKLAPVREDLVRASMRVLDLAGRRREALDLYGEHASELEHRVKGSPEPETRRLYDEIRGTSRARRA